MFGHWMRMFFCNRGYSPPRDISSPLVPDFYKVLDKNEQVEGNFQVKGVQ